MHIRLRHVIEIRTKAPMRGALQIFRTTPRSFEGQHSINWRVDVDQDCDLVSKEDAFGNITHELASNRPLSHFTVTIEGEVETFDTAGIIHRTRENFPPDLFLRSTPLTQSDEKVAAFAEGTTQSARTPLDKLHQLLKACHEHIAFDPTAPDTSASDTLKSRRGNSAGLAHLFTAAARNLAIPTRCISGYLLGEEGDGSVALHMWAEAFIAGLGWIGCDPANGHCPTEHYIRIACALDALGAQPVAATHWSDDAQVKMDICVNDTQAQRQWQSPKTTPELGTIEMTYCCGLLVRDGLVMVADTRTNAGIDNISTFRKLHKFIVPGRHVIMMASAGNLSATQSILHLVSEGFENPETKEIERLADCKTMFDAAQLVGRAIRRIHHLERGAYEQANLAFEVSFLLGGQIKGDAMRLFMIYAAGNFIECSQDAPFFQIGEYKYGKPVLDRAVSFDTSLDDALKVALVSMDSTMRSNLGVGLPIDIATCRRDAIELEVDERIDQAEPYFHDLRDRWSTALRQAHASIPAPPYGKRRK